jgi:Periplasmic binding protein domain
VMVGDGRRSCHWRCSRGSQWLADRMGWSAVVCGDAVSLSIGRSLAVVLSQNKMIYEFSSDGDTIFAAGVRQIMGIANPVWVPTTSIEEAMRALLVLLAALAVAQQAVAGQEIRVRAVAENTNNPFFGQARNGCKKVEKELNGAIEGLYVGPGEHGDGEEQVQVVNDLIARHVGSIAVSPSNGAAMGRALAAANRAGIPVLTWDACSIPIRKSAAPTWGRTTMRSV